MPCSLSALFFAAARGRISPRDLIVVLPFLLVRAHQLPGAHSRHARARPVGGPGDRDTRRHPPGLSPGFSTGLSQWWWSSWPCGWGSQRAESLPDDELFPVSAVAALAPGPLFHGDAVGGYLIYAAWPDRLVYTDDRAELYGEERFQEFVDVRAGRDGWQDVFESHGIDQALLAADATGLQEVLAASGWSERYRDTDFVVLSR